MLPDQHENPNIPEPEENDLNLSDDTTADDAIKNLPMYGSIQEPEKHWFLKRFIKRILTWALRTIFQNNPCPRVIRWLAKFIWWFHWIPPGSWLPDRDEPRMK